jgi:hypothetical protein
MLVIVVMLLFPSVPIWAQGQVSQVTSIEVNRTQSQNSEEMVLPPLPITPLSDSSFGNMPNLQTSSFVIQAVPEPSTFAFGVLVFGLIMIVRLIRKGSPADLN